MSMDVDTARRRSFSRDGARPVAMAWLVLVLVLWVGTASAQLALPITPHDNVSVVIRSDTRADVLLKEGTEETVELIRIGSSAGITLSFNPTEGLGLKVGSDDVGGYPQFVQATQPGDYESIPVFRVWVDVASGERNLLEIELINVNDNPPVVVTPIRCEVEEEVVTETNCIFDVTDRDGGASYINMVSDDDHFSFELVGERVPNAKSALYRLVVVTALDFEKYRLHSVTVTAEDNGQVAEKEVLDGYQESKVSFVVYVQDIPDEPPVWQKMTPFISVTEKESRSVTLEAVDGDFGLAWDIEYRLEFPDLPEPELRQYFHIGTTSGVLTVGEMDRDQLKQDIYNVRVVATEVMPPEAVEKWPDHEPENESQDIVVLLNDINDHFPELSPKQHEEFEVEEEKPFSCYSFSVEDPDLADNGSFTLTLEKNDWSDNFMLIPGSGYQKSDLTLSVVDPSRMDYENDTWKVFTLTLLAEEIAEPENHRSVATLVVHLKNLNDEYPEFEEPEMSQSIPENIPMGDVIVVVNATDPDEGDEVTYSLSQRRMAVNTETGEVVTTDENTFDFEWQQEVVFQVVATDLANHKAYCLVTITVTDVNDEPPVLSLPHAYEPTFEHSDVGTEVVSEIIATDPDTEADLEFSIDWDESFATKTGIKVEQDIFENTVKLEQRRVDESDTWQATLVVADKDGFDFEEFDTLRLVVVVTDRTTHPDYLHNKERNGVLTVSLNDTNDNPPIFTEDSINATLSIEENSKIGSRIGLLMATDADGFPHNIIRYSMIAIDPPGLVSFVENHGPQIDIDEDTGLVSVFGDIDCEEFENHTYIVTASDGEHSSPSYIIIDIIDVNDCKPEVEELKQTVKFTFEEKREVLNEPTAYCAFAQDEDVSVPYHTVTYMFNTRMRLDYIVNDYFTVDNATGCLSVINGTMLDREEREKYEMNITTRDNYADGYSSGISNEGDDINIIIELLDINDHDPEFVLRDTVTVSEDLKAGDTVLVVTVNDPDKGENGTITCEFNPGIIVEYPDGDRNDLFEVVTQSEEEQKEAGVSKQCTIIAKKDLEMQWGRYIVIMKAQDHGPGEQISSAEYSVHVRNTNLHPPDFTYPAKDGEILWLKKETDPLEDINGDAVHDITVFDPDDPETDNGKVDFFVEGDAASVFTLRYSYGAHSTVLQMTDPKDRQYNVTLKAQNYGTSPSPAYRRITINVIDMDSKPTFDVQDVVIFFSETEIGLNETVKLPQAVDEDNALLPSDMQKSIFYHIIDVPDIESASHLFTLKMDDKTPILSLTQELDYLEQTQYHIRVAATYEEKAPDPTVTGTSYIDVVVKVTDVNNHPPSFKRDKFIGTIIAGEHGEGAVVMTLEATDPDTTGQLKYYIVAGSEKGYNGMESVLNTYKKPFVVNEVTGVVSLNFSPQNNIKGYIEFKVVVHDEDGDEDEFHRDYADATVSAVSRDNEFSLLFSNEVNSVQTRKVEVEEIVSTTLEFHCAISEVKDISESGTTIAEAVLYCLDTQSSAPLNGEESKTKAMVLSTYQELARLLAAEGLSLRAIDNPTGDPDESSYLTTVLGAACAVLAVLALVILLAFVVRMRTLKRRLDNMTTTANTFGNEESGKGEGNLPVPGTNQYVMEGSNPVWKVNGMDDFDNLSQSSDDSDLVGIEESPDFGGDGDYPGPRHSVNPLALLSSPSSSPGAPVPARRVSVNPLAAAATGASPAAGVDFAHDDPFDGFSISPDAPAAPRRISVNPLAAMAEEADDDDFTAPSEAYVNFSFERDHDHATEL